VARLVFANAVLNCVEAKWREDDEEIYGNGFSMSFFYSIAP
jgi:hypothetical protein